MIYNFLSEYLSIIIFLFLALFLSIGFIIANFLASPTNPDPEKLSAYECGFEGEAKKLAKIKPMLKNKAKNKNIIIDKYSLKKL